MIILDPGHGGKLDNGAHAAYPREALLNKATSNPGEVIEYGRAGTGYVQSQSKPELIYEDDLNLQFGLKLWSNLLDLGIPVNPTRTHDAPLKLSSRIRAVNEYFRQGSQLAISIHHDSAPGSGARGFCAYYHPNSVKGQALAVALASAMSQAGYLLHGSGAKPAGLHGIRRLAFTHKTIGTAVLCEMEFMSHPSALRMAMDVGHQGYKARIMANTIKQFLEG